MGRKRRAQNKADAGKETEVKTAAIITTVTAATEEISREISRQISSLSVPPPADPLRKALRKRKEKDYQLWAGFHQEELEQMWRAYEACGNKVDPADFTYCVYLCTQPRFDKNLSRPLRPRESALG